MFRAGKKAQECHHVLLLDPVGVGASKLRTETAFRLMETLSFTAIRGNISEIKTLALGSGTTKGVDADVADAVTEENLDSAVSFVKNFAAAHGCVIAVTGAIDLVGVAQKCYVIRNGRAENGKNHRNRLPALRDDDSLSHSQQRPSARCCRSCRLCHGSCRRDCLERYAGRRRKSLLIETASLTRSTTWMQKH